jgi:hypothetical protein
VAQQPAPEPATTAKADGAVAGKPDHKAPEKKRMQTAKRSEPRAETKRPEPKAKADAKKIDPKTLEAKKTGGRRADRVKAKAGFGLKTVISSIVAPEPKPAKKSGHKSKPKS